MKKHLIIYGGTFDPVHLGHINTTKSVLRQIISSQIVFVPCKQPVLKNKANASATHRVNMLKLALNQLKNATLDTRELDRESPSYMIETLKSFRQDYPEQALSLLIGWDAFIHLPKWFQWQKILLEANLIVVNRPGFILTRCDKLLTLTRNNQILSHQDLAKHGKILFLECDEYDISSTKIRKLLHEKKSVSHLLQKPVHDYIMKMKLYL